MIDDPNEEKLMMVMEYVDGGCVDIKHPASEDQARKLFQDAAKVGNPEPCRCICGTQIISWGITF